MAAKKKEDVNQDVSVVNANSVLNSFLKQNKADHYNFEVDHNYKVKCSSLLLTSALGGGLGPGVHRFIGLASGGKTSCSLDFMYHFLNTPSPNGCARRGVYIKSEGRLSENVRNRSGITFVNNTDEWVDGTCFVFESNIYEAVFDLKRQLIQIPNLEIFFITDSTDSLIKRDDAQKPDDQAITVCGGSLAFSVFLKKVGLAMSKRGMVDLYISQIRDVIKIDKYEVVVPKQGKASGPRALEHQGDTVLEFLPRYSGELILEGEKKSKPIGHFCKCRILKTDNEKYEEVRYPIRYGQVGANSVWTSFEIVDMMIMWELVTKKGAWFPFSEGQRAELIAKFPDIEIPEQFHGSENIRLFLEKNEEIQKFLFDKFTSVVT